MTTEVRDLTSDEFACVDTDPELFFPGGGNPALAEPAKVFCRRCPAIARCLRYALTHQVQGVWGGTTEAERTVIRERHGITAVPVQFRDRRQEVVEEMSRGVSAAAIAAHLGTTARSITRARRRASVGDQPIGDQS